MALINNLEKGNKDFPTVHDRTEATYFIINTPTGEKILQIDTYGRATRDIPGKVSQSIQFSPQAIKELKKILTEF